MEDGTIDPIQNGLINLDLLLLLVLVNCIMAFQVFLFRHQEIQRVDKPSISQVSFFGFVVIGMVRYEACFFMWILRNDLTNPLPTDIIWVRFNSNLPPFKVYWLYACWIPSIRPELRIIEHTFIILFHLSDELPASFQTNNWVRYDCLTFSI